MKTKWITRLVNKITNSDFNLNNSFEYHRHKVVCQSGTTDFVVVFVDDVELFSFDFLVQELWVDFKSPFSSAIAEAFVEFYPGTTINSI